MIAAHDWPAGSSIAIAMEAAWADPRPSGGLHVYDDVPIGAGWRGTGFFRIQAKGAIHS
jgi:hypothetical protein